MILARATVLGVLSVLGAIALDTRQSTPDLDDGAEAKVLSVDCQVAKRIVFQRAQNLTDWEQERVAQAVCDEAQKAGYDVRWVLAVIEVESDFDARAVSQVGARGLMQLTDVTAEYLAALHGLSPRRDAVGPDAEWNVRLGVRYLADLHRRFQDLDMALMAYNAGPGKVRELRTTGGLSTYRVYPAKVRQAFERFHDEDRARREAMSLSK
ncbi:MAG: lytic transglycosylase domain-containing protein [Myxococcaceae bacterium]|nr:lytic transglycosylase domain-containing protein [Myxococcaceae bacterium]